MNRSLFKLHSHRKILQSFILNDNKYLNTSKILFSHWPKDVKPGPFPKTEEERIAAAKKYGMKYIIIIHIFI